MKRILIADDEASIRNLYADEMSAEGFEVICASTGQEAVQLAREQSPDLVVMDISMPGMDGIEALGRILEEDKQIPVVINTAYPRYKDSFLSWSADAYITKSSDLSELKDAIRELLGKRDRQIELNS